MTDYSDVDFEKVRDTAIAMITAALYANEKEDPDERAHELATGMKFAMPEDLTAGEFSSIPSILVQICESFVRLTSQSSGIPVDVLWEQSVIEIRQVPLFGEDW